MALVDLLRELLGAPNARSFQLMGEDLALLTGSGLRLAAAAYQDELQRVPPALRERFEAEQVGLAKDVHALLVRYNRSLPRRLAGYLELAQRCDHQYPWPVVAMLGICQVRQGLWRNRLWGLCAPAARRLGLPVLEELAEGTEDVLRRTNRGIFADSVPTVLLGLRAHQLARAGEAALGEALLSGPLPPLLDEEARAIARGIRDGLAEPDPARRFAALAQLVYRHFAREQAIFSHHLGDRRRRGGSGGGESLLVRRLAAPRQVPAPLVIRDRRGRRRVVFRPFALPAGFDLRDHQSRVERFAEAFVTPVVGHPEDYRAALDYVRARFGARRRS
jgi:hypothetical protein